VKDIAHSFDGSTVSVWAPDAEGGGRYEASYVVTSSQRPTGAILLEGSAYSVEGVQLTLQRPVPDLDYICESNNRLWGVSNSQENTIYNSATGKYETFTSRCIYASALGEPTAFYTFEGVDTDSYQVAVGSEGDFTAICDYSGVCCWKEDRLHKIIGDYPSDYYMSERELAGVQDGSHKSVVNINGTLFYKGRAGVYGFNGGTPYLISTNFGEHRYDDAVAGSEGLRYYISMQEGGDWHLYVYDTISGLWLEEDDTQVIDFCLLSGKLQALTADGRLLELEADADTDDDEPIEWSATFAPYTEGDMHERKNYLRVLLRMEQGGGSVSVEVEKDGVWTTAATLNSGENTAVIPIWPNRLDRIRIRLRGTAPCAILSMAREYTLGSILGGEKMI